MSTTTETRCTCHFHVPSKLELGMLATLTEMEQYAATLTSERKYQGVSDTMNSIERRVLAIAAKRLRKASATCPAARKPVAV